MDWKTHRKELLILIIFLLFGPLVGQGINAQTNTAVSPELYTAIERKLRIEELLKGKDVTTLNQEELQKLISESLAAGVVPNIGTMTEATGSYIFATGLAGVAVGQVPKGEYTIKINPIPDIVAESPQTFLAASGTKNELLVGMRQGGKSRPIRPIYQFTNLPINFFKNLLSFWQLWLVQRRPESGQILDTCPPSAIAEGKCRRETIITDNQIKVPLVVKLFQDINANGSLDPGEKPVPWANVKITLTKISTEQSLSLKQGINTVRFEKVPENLKTAYKIVAEAVTNGMSEATLISLKDNVPQSVTARGSDFFGADFEVLPMTDYLLLLPQELKLTLIQRP